jgi:SAM-dependent methyltransferase
MGTGNLPVDWYRSTFSGDTRTLFWEDGVEEKVELALAMLAPDGDERILDLACTSGKRTLELNRRGFEVVGTDVDEYLLEVGGGEAEREGLDPTFHESDPRQLDFLREFDLALSLSGGAFGYFGEDEDDRVAFQRVSQALRPGGRLLMQTPNVIYVETQLPERTWLPSEATVQLVEQAWDETTGCLEASMTAMIEGEGSEEDEPVPFRRRIYTVEELAQIFESVGMELVDVFDEDGDPCAPTEDQQQIFVEARF